METALQYQRHAGDNEPAFYGFMEIRWPRDAEAFPTIIEAFREVTSVESNSANWLHFLTVHGIKQVAPGTNVLRWERHFFAGTFKREQMNAMEAAPSMVVSTIGRFPQGLIDPNVAWITTFALSQLCIQPFYPAIMTLSLPD